MICLCFSFSDIYYSNNQIENFEQLLDNIFRPLFEVSINPSSHPDLHRFLRQVYYDLHSVNLYVVKSCIVLLCLVLLHSCYDLGQFVLKYVFASIVVNGISVL